MRKQVVPFTIELEDREEVPARASSEPRHSRTRTARTAIFGGLAGLVCGFGVVTFGFSTSAQPAPEASASPVSASVPVDSFRGMTPDAIEHWLVSEGDEVGQGLPSTPDAAERWLHEN